MLEGDSAELRKQRGAFFTPYPIAEFLASWALAGKGGNKTVLDPTSGEGVFLLAAAEQMRSASAEDPGHIYGVDIHAQSAAEASRLLTEAGNASHTVLTGDFFDEIPPDQIGARLPFVDAVVGNPPFVRYHEHRGETRRKAAAAALANGVRLSGLASSWAALLVHAASFLKPDGRLAMVVPAELLSVGYAEPIRLWLRRRFRSVHLVLFNELQFADAEEQVVLLVARGRGQCNAFTLHEVAGAEDLASLHIFDAEAFAPNEAGKWTDLLLPEEVRTVLREIGSSHFQQLAAYGDVELGTVTGANRFFTLSEATRVEYELQPDKHVVRTVPPGSRHTPGLQFTSAQWEHLRLRGERVWMLNPSAKQPTGKGFLRYVALGKDLGVHQGYKCSIRDPWWKPPVQPAPDLFFTYMSHVAPRLIDNAAGVTYVNSMHGLTLNGDALWAGARDALPVLMLNTATMLSAEITGRSYGGGVLKMEPREAASLAVPALHDLEAAWALLKSERHVIDELVKTRRLGDVVERVDRALLTTTLGLSDTDLHMLRTALLRQRARRQRREQRQDGSAD